MSVSCIGTCSACGVQRFWLSDTLAIQMDDGSLKCLPHPREDTYCEREGLTLEQAYERGRLFRETFYVCRSCGRMGEIIEPCRWRQMHLIPPQTFLGDLKLMLWIAGFALPVSLWLRWWGAVAAVLLTVVVFPLNEWRKRHKEQRTDPRRLMPLPSAPGRTPIPAPTRGSRADQVVGRANGGGTSVPPAIGPCCERPDWIAAFSVKDEDKIRCCVCGCGGVMTVSEHSIH